MPSTFLGLNTSKSGLDYYQAAINTTAHNVSNAETKGYSRQVVSSQASSALRMYSADGMQGTGVTITGISQIRNGYYDVKYWNNKSNYGEYQSKYDYSYEIETYFNEMNSPTGYTALLTQLATSLQDLANDPSNDTTRVQYTNDFKSYTELFNEMATNLQITQTSLNDEIAIRVNEINALSRQIFALNDQINNVELRGGNANDLRDQRMLMVDQMSEIVNVTTEEIPIKAEDGHNSGANRFVVRINGELLLDDLQCKQLTVAPREKKVNETDIKGLYDVYWKNVDETPGDTFNIYSPTLTGKLAGLVAVRDGNNDHGYVGHSEAAGNGVDANGNPEVYLKMTTNKPFYIQDLNMADNGVVVVNGVQYFYESFDAEYDNATGEITSYTFHGLEGMSEDRSTHVPISAADIEIGVTARVGTNVDFEGVPYYMSRLNEFVRTFSRYINDLTTGGVDAEGNDGLDMLTTLDTAGNDYDLKSTVGNTQFNSKEASYYRLNCLNWRVSDTITKEPKKVVVSSKRAIEQGNVEDNSVIRSILDSLTNNDIFKQGSPAQYLESTTSTLAVQTKRCKTSSEHLDNIVYSINQQRLSESSVDQNEEAASLMVQRNGYNLACKVISVLDEIYDRLINNTGV